MLVKIYIAKVQLQSQRVEKLRGILIRNKKIENQ